MATWLKNRSRKLPLSPELPPPPLPISEMQQQTGDSKYNLSTRQNHKRPKLLKVVETTCQVRSWNDMDHDILVIIMKKLLNSFRWWTLHYDTLFFCKSWLLALLDALFPPGAILDLRYYDKFDCKREQARYCYLLHLALGRFRPQNHYTKVLFCESSTYSFPWPDFASRLPLVKSISFPTTTNINLVFIVGALLHWRNLEEVCCNVSIVKCLAKYCKFIHSLTLFGRISCHTASLIAENFPTLKRLKIPSCVLSVNALSTILDGQKKLEYLDTSQCFCVYEEELCWTQLSFCSVLQPLFQSCCCFILGSIQPEYQTTSQGKNETRGS